MPHQVRLAASHLRRWELLSTHAFTIDCSDENGLLSAYTRPFLASLSLAMTQVIWASKRRAQLVEARRSRSSRLLPIERDLHLWRENASISMCKIYRFLSNSAEPAKADSPTSAWLHGGSVEQLISTMDRLDTHGGVKESTEWRTYRAAFSDAVPWLQHSEGPISTPE